jgi:hypothetical protein
MPTEITSASDRPVPAYRRLLRSKDLWAGLAFTGSAAAFGIAALDYGLGSATRMEPGFFPAAVAILLAIFGLALIFRSLVRPGEFFYGFAAKAVFLVLGSMIAFGALARDAGLAVALPLLLLVSASASERFYWRSALLLAIGATLVSILVFVQALGLPFPILGRWLAG